MLAQLTVCAARDDEFYKLDVTSAYLYGELEEAVYMKTPEGMDIEGQGVPQVAERYPRAETSRPILEQESCVVLCRCEVQTVGTRRVPLLLQGARWQLLSGRCGSRRHGFDGHSKPSRQTGGAMRASVGSEGGQKSYLVLKNELCMSLDYTL